jgi:hypothetical protein
MIVLVRYPVRLNGGCRILSRSGCRFALSKTCLSTKQQFSLAD